MSYSYRFPGVRTFNSGFHIHKSRLNLCLKNGVGRRSIDDPKDIFYINGPGLASELSNPDELSNPSLNP